MTKVQAAWEFKTYHLPALCDQRPTTRRTAWNDFTDYLYKDGRITLAQVSCWVFPRCCK
jgi:hypothetical protein